MTDAEILASFRDGSLPVEEFHHAQHVRVAWLFVQQYGMPGALAEFSAALRDYALAKGLPTLYHQTITWAYLLLIDQRNQQTPATDWTSFKTANPDLLTWRPSILERFYTSETLWSEQARRTFLMPDRIG